jgi:CRISPR-associated protein Cmr4
VTPHLLKIECLTNMHVGGGEVSYSAVDNDVQKDTVLDVPVIHSSGVKGALRAHFSDILETDSIERIFGRDSGNDRGTSQGTHKFFDAFCLARPLRLISSADASKAYVLAAGLDGLRHYVGFLRALGFEQWEVGDPQFADEPFVTAGQGGRALFVEGEDAAKETGIDRSTNQALTALVGQPYALAETLDPYPLPVIARNCLENGQSVNLWYEQLVPHKSIFYTVVISPTDQLELKFDHTPVQFGGNATVGYGYTHVKVVSLPQKKGEAGHVSD